MYVARNDATACLADVLRNANPRARNWNARLLASQFRVKEFHSSNEKENESDKVDELESARFLAGHGYSITSTRLFQTVLSFFLLASPDWRKND